MFWGKPHTYLGDGRINVVMMKLLLFCFLLGEFTDFSEMFSTPGWWHTFRAITHSPIRGVLDQACFPSQSQLSGYVTVRKFRGGTKTQARQKLEWHVKWNVSKPNAECGMYQDRMRGTHFRLISRNKWTLILLKNNWKLTCLSSPMNDVYDFVDAPLVT